MRPALLMLAAAAAAPLTGCGPDTGQVRLCEAAVARVEGLGAEEFTIVAREDAGAHRIVLSYRLAGEEEPRTATCAFGGGAFDEGRLDLVGLETESVGTLSPISIMMLRRDLGLR